jgi:hypothetical protein
MIRAQGLDLEFWAEVVNTVVYIKNRCPTKALDSKTPQEAWNTFEYCSTKDMVADVFTKALPNERHKNLITMFGLETS